MKKHEAIELLGGTVKNTARALGVTTQAIYLWPDVLSDAQEGKVMLALLRGAGAPARGLPKLARTSRLSRARNNAR